MEQNSLSHNWGPRLLGLGLAVGLAAMGSACITVGPEQTADPEGLAGATRDVGIDYLNRGRTAMAIRKLTEALKQDPGDAIGHMSLGEAYRRKGMLSEAEQSLLESLRLNADATDHNHQETLLNLSVLYIQLKRYEEARAQCQKLVDNPTFPAPWRAYTNRGWAEFRAGRYDLARRSFESALDFHPRYAPAHLDLGLLDQTQKRWLSAIRHFEVAVEVAGFNREAVAESNFHLAEIYVALGRREKAIEHLEGALAGSPLGHWGRESKSYLELLR